MYVKQTVADDLDRRLWEFADHLLTPDLMRLEIDAWFAAAVREAYAAGQRDAFAAVGAKSVGGAVT